MFNKESFNSMLKARNIEFAYRGMKVNVCGKDGKLIGNYGHNLLVRFDGVKGTANCHPHYMAKYYDEQGNLIKEYKD